MNRDVCCYQEESGTLTTTTTTTLLTSRSPPLSPASIPAPPPPSPEMVLHIRQFLPSYSTGFSLVSDNHRSPAMSTSDAEQNQETNSEEEQPPHQPYDEERPNASTVSQFSLQPPRRSKARVRFNLPKPIRSNSHVGVRRSSSTKPPSRPSLHKGETARWEPVFHLDQTTKTTTTQVISEKAKVQPSKPVRRRSSEIPSMKQLHQIHQQQTLKTSVVPPPPPTKPQRRRSSAENVIAAVVSSTRSAVARIPVRRQSLERQDSDEPLVMPIRKGSLTGPAQQQQQQQQQQDSTTAATSSRRRSSSMGSFATTSSTADLIRRVLNELSVYDTDSGEFTDTDFEEDEDTTDFTLSEDQDDSLSSYEA